MKKGPFKMRGPSLYGKLKVNRDMDKSSLPDGRSKSSAVQMKKSPAKAAQTGRAIVRRERHMI